MSKFLELLHRPFSCSVSGCNPRHDGRPFTSDSSKRITFDGVEEFAIWFPVFDGNLKSPICLYHTRKLSQLRYVRGIVKLPEVLYGIGKHELLNEAIYLGRLGSGITCEGCNFDPCFHTSNTPLSMHRINNGKMVFTMWWDELEKQFLCFEIMMGIESWLRRKLRKEGPTGRFKPAIVYIAEQVYSPVEKGTTQSFADLVQIKS